MTITIKKFILIAILIALIYGSQNILNFGAIPNEDSLHAQLKNQKAINDAIIKANST